jgi:hypothetical protein
VPYVEPGLITDQHTSRIAEPGHHEPADVITDRIGIPCRGTQQPPHRLRITTTGPVTGTLAILRDR